jgi:hypothetical protein
VSHHPEVGENMTIGDFLDYLNHAIAAGHADLDTPIFVQHDIESDSTLFDSNLSIGDESVIIEAWHPADVE